MKNIFFGLFAVVLICSICFAEEAAVPATTGNFTGKVYSVSSGSGISKISSQITVRNDSGEEATFAVASDATITGKDGNSTTLNWIGKGDKVSIDYITNEDGTETAKSIKVSTDW